MSPIDILSHSNLISHCIDVVVASAIVVLKLLVQLKLQQHTVFTSDIFSPVSIISRLAYRIDEIHHPQAKSCIIWLVGQYAAAPETGDVGIAAVGPEGVAPWAPDVLRKAAITFSKEVCINILVASAQLD